MSKVTALLAIVVVVLLISSTATNAARPDQPAISMVEAVKTGDVVSCEGVADTDGCLNKRTLTADIDYIYSVDP